MQNNKYNKSIEMNVQIYMNMIQMNIDKYTTDHPNDPMLTLINSIMPELPKEDHMNLLTRNYALVINRSSNNKSPWEVLRISPDMNEVYNLCKALRGKANGYLVWSQIGYINKIIEYKTASDIKIWSYDDIN